MSLEQLEKAVRIAKEGVVSQHVRRLVAKLSLKAPHKKEGLLDGRLTKENP